MTPFALLLPAAGVGTRMGGRKTLLHLAGRPILLHTLDRFLPFRERMCQTIIVAHPDDVRAVADACPGAQVVAGGARRQDSVSAGLALLRPEAELVVIHDAVRPFVAPEAIAAALDAAEAAGAAIVATPMKPTVKRVAQDMSNIYPQITQTPRSDSGSESVKSVDHSASRVVATVDRRDLWCAQTPQVFRRQLIIEAYTAAERDGLDATDDAQLVERLGRQVAIVPGSDLNLKITTPEDLALAEAILACGLAPTGNRSGGA